MPGDRCGDHTPLWSDCRGVDEGSGWPHCQALSPCKGPGISCPARSGFSGRGWPPERKPSACQAPQAAGQGPRRLSGHSCSTGSFPPRELASTQSPQLGAGCSLWGLALRPATSCFWSWPFFCPWLGLRQGTDPGS